MKKIAKNILVFIALFFIFSIDSFAAPFPRVSIRYDRQKQSTPTGAQIVFVPVTSAASVNKIVIIFGAGVSIAPSANIVGSTGGLPSGTVGLPGALTFTKVGNSELDITAMSALSTGVTYAFNIGTTYGAALNPGLSTPSTTGSIVDSVATYNGATLYDNGDVANYIVTNDQITINASVAPLFTFQISPSCGGTDSFPFDINNYSVDVSHGCNITASTNAPKGWIGWFRSANAGAGGTAALTSLLTGESIGTTGTLGGANTTCVNNFDCYILSAGVSASTSGAAAIPATYAGGLGNTGATGGAIATNVQPFQTFAFGTAKTQLDTINVRIKASVSGVKAAGGDYTDILTFIGSGNF